MKKQDLIRIETELGITLPLSYKKLILHYPFGDHKAFHAVRESLLEDPDEIICVNHKIRQEGFHGKQWPSKFYILGRMGENNFYFIDVTQEPSECIYFAQDDEKFNPKNIKKLLLYKDFERFLHGQQFLQQVFDKSS